MDTILLAALAAITSIVAYWACIQRERILLLTEQIDALTWQVTRDNQRANVLSMTITRHLEAKQALLDEMDALERHNNFLRHKRSGRNAPSMKHASVYGHHRGGSPRGAA